MQLQHIPSCIIACSKLVHASGQFPLIGWLPDACNATYSQISIKRLMLQIMQDTGADFTNTFRHLADIPMPSATSTSLNGEFSSDYQATSLLLP